MSSDPLKKRGTASEEAYFNRIEAEAIERLKARTDARKSPVTGEPMTQATLMGVVIDKCPTSGGIWLDAGELEQILQKASEKDAGGLGNFFSNFIASVVSDK
jgi:hypothetical protein